MPQVGDMVAVIPSNRVLPSSFTTVFCDSEMHCCSCTPNEGATDAWFCTPFQMVAFSAGLLVHAQRALAVATSGSTHVIEEQLQRLSMQVSFRFICVDRHTCLFSAFW